VEASSSGTVVMISKIDNLQNRNITSFSNTLIKNCGQIFRDFLNANKVLSINRKLVMAIDPMMRKDSGTVELIDKTNIFTNEHGDKSEMRIRIFMLPSFTALEAKDKKINIRGQGFYLMRNNREIANGETLDIFNKHNDYNRFRAEIYFDGALDKMVGVNFKKQNISLYDEVRSWVRSIAFPQAQAVRDTAKKSQMQNREDKPMVDHTPTQRIVSSRKTVLKKPKIAGDKDGKLAALNHDSNVFSNVQFKEENNTHLAPLYRVNIEGEKIVITYNADHAFYQTVFIGQEENKELVNAIDSLVFSASLALIGITSSETNLHLKDEFLDNMSDNLRSLLA
jgi:hypothetical protein